MAQNYSGEKWKTLVFDFEFTSDCRYEISDFGRLRSFNNVADGNMLNGSSINGYRIIRLKFFRLRDEKSAKKFSYLQQQVLKLQKKLNTSKRYFNELQKKNAEYYAYKKEIEETTPMLQNLKKNLSKKFAEDTKSRTIHYHSLIHRLVAVHFCKKPSAKHTLVAHLDFDKLNNKKNNLKWMTPEENMAHQQKSPYVIANKEKVRNHLTNAKNVKLTVTKVMLLKKLLNEGKSLKTLVKTFKITDTQILRIKRGENWGDIKAAT